MESNRVLEAVFSKNYNIYIDNKLSFIKTLEANRLIVPALYYYWKHENCWCLTDNYLKLEQFLKAANEPIRNNLVLCLELFKKAGLKQTDDGINSHMATLNKIITPTKSVKVLTEWKKITIDEKGLLTVVKSENVFKTVPIRQAYPLIKDWITKYSKLNYDICIPELSAGLDTRILTYFWRNKTKVAYNLSRKPYQKKHYDGDIAALLAKRLNIRLVDSTQNYAYKLCGSYTEPFRKYGLNNDTFYKACVPLKLVKNNLKIYPFIDDLFVKINPEKGDLLHTCLLYLLVPDLLDIPFWTYLFEDTYTINDLPIDEAKDIVNNYWLKNDKIR